MKYYVAYGSNTPQEMRFRCPDSKFLGVAKLSGFALLFRYYATVEEKKRSKLKVMLYQISDDDELLLDYYEGYPSLYDKKEVEVKFHGKRLEALIYYIPEEAKSIASLRFPSQEYLTRCLYGYCDSGLPLKQLSNAVLYTATRIKVNRTITSTDID